jgi:hypothetical protein
VNRCFLAWNAALGSAVRPAWPAMNVVMICLSSLMLWRPMAPFENIDGEHRSLLLRHVRPRTKRACAGEMDHDHLRIVTRRTPAPPAMLFPAKVVARTGHCGHNGRTRSNSPIREVARRH